MSGIIKITVIVFCFTLSGCNILSPKSSSLSTNKILLDQVNTTAKNDPDWFSSSIKAKKDLKEKYNGNQQPEMAIYLENDLFIYKDDQISAYILEIINRLLQGWEGVKPTIMVVIESGKYFSVYVDELHQLHVATGVLRKIENEDQLASIIAHELSHVLLRHNSEKNLSERAGSTLETSGMLIASGGTFLGSLTEKDEYRDMGQDVLLGSQSLGFIWVDMLIPKWSRENEKEADLMGLDLLMRANYNYEELPTVIEFTADAEAQRSERLNKFSKLAFNYLDKYRQGIRTSIGGKVDKYLKDVGSAFENLFIAHVSMNIADLNKSHDDRAERIDALKTYLNNVYGGGDLPPEPSRTKFEKIVRGKNSQARLNQDLAAIELIDALQNRDFSLAAAKLAGIRYSHLSPVSCCIAKSSMDISEKKYNVAIKALDNLVQNNTSPAEVYLQLAELHNSKRNYGKAESSLQLGIKAIGRDYKFLPMLIQVSKSAGNIAAAEEYTIRCKQYDDGVLLPFTQSGSKRNGNDTYYKECVKILGYDVQAKRKKDIGASEATSSTGVENLLQKVFPFSQ